jgi:hypothetical protein
VGAGARGGIIDIPVAGKLSRDNRDGISAAGQVQGDGQANDTGTALSDEVNERRRKRYETTYPITAT